MDDVSGEAGGMGGTVMQHGAPGQAGVAKASVNGGAPVRIGQRPITARMWARDIS
ncbi:MAG: hypothetical protein LBF51_00720 [Zoogloeaceae bacterium]|nr:hypothetical protein [Zoogloeaceae bacterium]